MKIRMSFSFPITCMLDVISGVYMITTSSREAVQSVDSNSIGVFDSQEANDVDIANFRWRVRQGHSELIRTYDQVEKDKDTPATNKPNLQRRVLFLHQPGEHRPTQCHNLCMRAQHNWKESSGREIYSWAGYVRSWTRAGTLERHDVRTKKCNIPMARISLSGFESKSGINFVIARWQHLSKCLSKWRCKLRIFV
jgi:hypothetical protein